MSDKSLILLQQKNTELVKENEALKQTVVQLLEKIKQNETQVVPSNVTRIVKTAEQKIIEEQIAHLETISFQRALTLEETRALDLLIKNKRLLDPEKPLEPDYTKVPEGQTESDLLRIAGNVEVDTSHQRKAKFRAKTSS